MIRVAVVGVGAMGKNHVRVYQEMPETELVAVVDERPATADQVSQNFHVPAYSNYQEMVEKEHPQAVTVAVPTVSHFTVAKGLLEAGCDVLLEKPIAATLEEAAELVNLAEQLGRLLMVGHIERFNPAVIELKSRLDRGDLGRIYQICTRRLGPFPPRIRDVGVVMDLATHDLDIMRYLTGSEVIRVFAEAKQELHASQEDLFAGILRFENDMLGMLEINWLTPAKIRELFVTGERGMFRVDYLTQDLYFYENAATNGNGSPSTAPGMGGVSEGKIIQYPIQKKEPLRAELEAFIANMQGKKSLYANGHDAWMALLLAKTLVDSTSSCKVEDVNYGDNLEEPKGYEIAQNWGD